MAPLLKVKLGMGTYDPFPKSEAGHGNLSLELKPGVDGPFAKSEAGHGNLSLELMELMAPFLKVKLGMGTYPWS